MDKTNTKPVILLAFANDRTAGGEFLSQLDEERRRLEDILHRAEAEGSCEVVTLKYATPQELVDEFQKLDLRGRVAILHYAGHAQDDTNVLLMESQGWKKVHVSSQNLANFLGHQDGLKLVFLNACGTYSHVQDLLKAGVSSVLFTDSDVDSETAMLFAICFYRSLASGYSLQRAFEEATDAAKLIYAQYDETGNHKAAARELDITARLNSRIVKRGIEQVSDNKPPQIIKANWLLETRPGAEPALDWSLSKATNKPLLGLPSIDHYPLPPKPFLGLVTFKREQARVFFGRGEDIRQIYDSLTSVNRNPIILLYGQSGVGKSSLLTAGLLPRLEAYFSAIVHIARPDRASLLKQVITQVSDSSDATTASLDAAWREREAQSKDVNKKRRLLVVVDQLDELFTGNKINQLEEFINALLPLFSSMNNYPGGKLILGFRKEWLADMEEYLEQASLPYESIHLDRLKRSGIIEAITQIEQDSNLKAHYKLTIDADLPSDLATDLLADPNAPVAPTLQILLSRLWEITTSKNREHPVFDLENYQKQRRQGVLLDDFLEQQIKQIETEYPHEVKSGLLLDILNHHTTVHGTSDICERSSLEIHYSHIKKNIISGLLDYAISTGILVTGGESGKSTRLAHDTLAPLIRRRIENSDSPGQRARRILDARVQELTHNPKTVLPADDLVTVKEGIGGMRHMMNEERALYDRSKKSRNRTQWWRRSAMMAGIVAITAILYFGVEAKRQEAEAKRQEAIAKTQTLKAQEQTKLAVERGEKLESTNEQLNSTANQLRSEKERADKEAVISKANAELAKIESQRATTERNNAFITQANLLSEKSLQVTKTGDATLGALLALEAIEIGRKANKKIGQAEGALYQSITNLHEEKIFRGHKNDIKKVMFGYDNRIALSVSRDDTAILWDIAKGSEIKHFSYEEKRVIDASFDSTGKNVVLVLYGTTGDKKKKGFLQSWNTVSQKYNYDFVGHDSIIKHVDINAKNNYILTSAVDNSAKLWRLSDGDFLHGWDEQESYGKVAISNNGEYSATEAMIYLPQKTKTKHLKFRYVIRLYSNSNGELLHKLVFEDASTVTQLLFDPNSKYLVSGSSDYVRIWDIQTGDLVKTLNEHKVLLRDITFSPDGKVMAVVGNSELVLFSIQDKKILDNINANINSINYSEDGRYILTTSDDGSIEIGNASSYKRLLVMKGHSNKVTTATFSNDLRYQVLSGANDHTIRLWNPLNSLRFFSAKVIPHLTFSSLSPNNSELLVLGKVPEVYNILERRKLQTLSGLGGDPWRSDFTADGKLAVISSLAGEIGVWDAISWEMNRKFEIHEAKKKSTAPYFIKHPIENSIFIPTPENNGIRKYNLENGTSNLLFFNSTPIHFMSWDWKACVISKDGKIMAFAVSQEGRYKVFVIDSSTGVFINKIQLPQDISLAHGIYLSPDDKDIFASAKNGSILRYNINSGKLMQKYNVETGTLMHLAFSVDGKLIASSGKDGFVRIWNVETGELLQALGKHTLGSSVSVFSKDGSRIATGGYGVKLWDLNSGALLFRYGNTWLRDLYFMQNESLLTAVDASGPTVFKVLPSGQKLEKYARSILARNELTLEERKQYFLATDDFKATSFGNQSYLYLLEGRAKEALSSVQSGLKLDPDQIWMRANLAHAYMYLDQIESAREVYFQYIGQEIQGKLWEVIIQDDFKQLREAGLPHPLMDEVVTEFKRRSPQANK